MAMVGWVWAGMEVVDDMLVGQSQGGLVACRDMLEHFRSEGDTLMSQDHTAIQERSSG